MACLYFLLIGMSIGVHLLCLLCIPAIVMAYYFKRRNSFNYALMRKYFIWTVLIGGILGVLLAFIGAQADADPNKNIPVDGTVAALLMVGTIVAIALLYIIERVKKERKEYYGGLYIFLIFGFILLGVVQIGVIQYSIKAAGCI
jgi:ABC-type iron transport system FetAB permease component